MDKKLHVVPAATFTFTDNLPPGAQLSIVSREFLRIFMPDLKPRSDTPAPGDDAGGGDSSPTTNSPT